MPVVHLSSAATSTVYPLYSHDYGVFVVVSPDMAGTGTGVPCHEW